MAYWQHVCRPRLPKKFEVVLQNFENKKKGTNTLRMSSHHEQNNLFLDPKPIIERAKLIFSHY
jgi:hypothetical protein